MKFKEYQHIERLGTTVTEDIEFGTCYIFYKIDGTNGQVYLDDKGNIKAGGRRRELTLDKDNAGFYKYVLQNENIKKYLAKHPNHRLYGEWLVPHSLKTYRQSAWRKFYIFDVCYEGEDNIEYYLNYNTYKEFLDEFDLDYIPPLAILKNPTIESFINCLEKTGQFLVEDGKGAGEGIVIKNYEFCNKYGNIVWAKIIRNEFKEKHAKEMGPTIVNQAKSTEELIVNKYCTESFIEKEYAKLVLENDGWSSKYIPILLNTIYRELIKEEIYNILMDFKNPAINFKILYALVVQKIKETKKEIFS